MQIATQGTRRLKDLRIGYGPTDHSLEAPGDRRRFCYYARKRQIGYEIAKPAEEYDVVVLTQGADISVWRHYPRTKTKIIFDLPDAYLAIPPMDAKGMLRGLAKFAVRQNQRLLLSYTRGLEEMCGRADAVICTAEEQSEQILPFCKNVHPILDFQEAAVRCRKQDYAAGDVLNLVWEGLPGNVQFLQEIGDVLRGVQRKRKVALHVVTALRYGKYLHGRVGRRRTEDEAAKIFRPLYLYAWNEATIAAISCACDLAVIPIPMKDKLCAGKPENKLMFFWRLGMPTIVSATAAHKRAMKECGLAMACSGADEWKAMIEKYAASEDARREAGRRGEAFAEKHWGEERLLAQWDRAFDSVLDGVAEAREDEIQVPTDMPVATKSAAD